MRQPAVGAIWDGEQQRRKRKANKLRDAGGEGIMGRRITPNHRHQPNTDGNGAADQCSDDRGVSGAALAAQI
jgi:hypothetical protein